MECADDRRGPMAAIGSRQTRIAAPSVGRSTAMIRGLPPSIGTPYAQVWPLVYPNRASPLPARCLPRQSKKPARCPPKAIVQLVKHRNQCVVPTELARSTVDQREKHPSIRDVFVVGQGHFDKRSSVLPALSLGEVDRGSRSNLILRSPGCISPRSALGMLPVQGERHVRILPLFFVTFRTVWLRMVLGVNRMSPVDWLDLFEPSSGTFDTRRRHIGDLRWWTTSRPADERHVPEHNAISERPSVCAAGDKFDLFVALGRESVGPVRYDSTSILTQQLFSTGGLPGLARGGGPARTVARSEPQLAGVLCEPQLAVLRESVLPPRMRQRLATVELDRANDCADSQRGSSGMVRAVAGRPATARRAGCAGISRNGRGGAMRRHRREIRAVRPVIR